MDLHRKNIIIWCADGTPIEGKNYADAIAERLCAKHEVTLSVIDLTTATLADAQTAEADLHIFTGGSTSVNDRAADSWMPEGLKIVEHLLSKAHIGLTRVLGICLGSQMMAEVLNPGCIASGAELKLGVSSAGWHDGKTRPMTSFHYEIITDPDGLIDAGATILATAADVPVAAFRYGPTVLAVQQHPEFTRK